MLARVFATATCPSVWTSGCLSGRLSHAGIVPSRAKAGSWNVHYLTLVSGEVWFIEKFARGHPKGTCQMREGWVFSAIFDQYVVISRKRCILDTKLLWDGNRKPYAGYRVVSLSMTLSDPWPGFLGHSSFKRRVQCMTVYLQSDAFYRHSYYIGRNSTPYSTLSISKLAIQLTTTPMLLRKPCKLFAGVARVCQRQLGFLV